RADDERLRLGPREADPLDVEAFERLGRARLLDEAPFPSGARDPAVLGAAFEEGASNSIHVRLPAGYDEHRHPELGVQPRDVDDVESGDRDALKENGLQ